MVPAGVTHINKATLGSAAHSSHRSTKKMGNTEGGRNRGTGWRAGRKGDREALQRISAEILSKATGDPEMMGLRQGT